jgi:excisionase family DNA binding protein
MILHEHVKKIEHNLVAFVSVEDAAKFLGICKSTAYDAAHEGQLCDGVPVVKVGRRYLVATKHLRRIAGIDEAKVEEMLHGRTLLEKRSS